MAIKDKAKAFSKKFKLDSHHAIERFGIFFGAFVLVGVVITGSSAASAFQSDNDALSATALYHHDFTTSKTQLEGTVDGVFRNTEGNKALVMMHFAPEAPISYDAADYQAFLLGTTPEIKDGESLPAEPLKTSGIKGKFYLFGSTGYVGVVLEADQAFDKQVMNLTVRANEELTFVEQQEDGASGTELASDATFEKYDQWRVFFNPGGSEAKTIKALDTQIFDPTKAYHEVVQASEEEAVRTKLDDQLSLMRSDLTRINSYSSDLQTTKVDGLHLRAPKLPKAIAGDEVVGESAAQSKDKKSSQALKTDTVLPGGFDISWRDGSVQEGYLHDLVPAGQNYAQFLEAKSNEAGEGEDIKSEISGMKWKLSDGSNLTEDYRSSDVVMQPLMSVMNNLTQAYTDYATNKATYQVDQMLELLALDVQLQNVQANTSVSSDTTSITSLY